jgi:hypothetical protein
MNKWLIAIIIVVIIIILFIWSSIGIPYLYKRSEGLWWSHPPAFHDHNKRILDQMRFQALDDLRIIETKIASLPDGSEKLAWQREKANVLNKLRLYYI